MKTETPSKFTDQGKVAGMVWDMRLADLPRADNRVILNRTYNGEPPFDRATAEENNIEVNRNFLEGTGILTDARNQWNANFLGAGNMLNVQLDCGPVHKKQEWGQTITRHLNRALKQSPEMMVNTRETGAGVLLHGIGPSVWENRRSPIPKVIPISSLMIPSETDIDFSNLEYFAIFREQTPAQLYERTHGPKVDPGWNMDLVMQEIKFVASQTQKGQNSAAFEFMPERIEEIIKQDIGYWNSDAVPTIDYWDFYYRETNASGGWCRKCFLDWGSGGRDVTMTEGMPSSNPNNGTWLYNAGKRKYADHWSQILHVNYGDCSCVAPFKYHSVRSLGWMNWGIVDIGNQMQCKMTEQAFSDLMWFFRVASQGDFNRIKKADFLHMGVVPSGIDFIKGNERFAPNPQFIQMVMEKNRSMLAANSTSYTRSSERMTSEKEKTATQVMAEVNSANAMTSGVMNLAKLYETSKYREICRRLCIKHNPDTVAKKFRKDCIHDGVDPEYLDTEKWIIEAERAMGAGNKTVQMAIVQYLNTVRPNLGPESQRKVDNIGIRIMTDDAAIAEDLASTKGQPPVSKSMHDAELTTDRLMRGLPLTPTPHMIYEDYVVTWLRDMGLIIQQIQGTTNMGTQEQIMGLQNMAQHIGMFLEIMSGDEAAGPKVRQFGELLGQMMNVVKGFAQRLQEQQQSQNGSEANGELALKQAELQSKQMVDQAKIQSNAEKTAQTQAQKQAAFELQEQRKDREMEAQIKRDATTEFLQTAADIRQQGRDAIKKENTPNQATE